MSVAIYMEGGGNGKDTKDALRRGMDVLLGPLKQVARARSMRWKLVCCGPRDSAFRGFRNAARNGDATIVMLLVDAEGPVATDPSEYLEGRDGWDMTGTDANLVHLMVQTMETWIVADADALAGYYGQHFNTRALPGAANLEGVAKRDVEDALRRATERTQKGRYHKIRHASELLQRMDAETVKTRCHHCRRLFDDLGQMIDAV